MDSHEGATEAQPTRLIAPGPIPVSYKVPVNYYDTQQALSLLQILLVGSAESTGSVRWLKERGSSSLDELDTKSSKWHVKPERVLSIVNIREFDDISVRIKYQDGTTAHGRLLDNSLKSILWVTGGGQAEQSVLRCVHSAAAYRSDRRHALRVASLALLALVLVAAAGFLALITVLVVSLFGDTNTAETTRFSPVPFLVGMAVGAVLSWLPITRRFVDACYGWTSLARLTSPDVANGQVPLAALGVLGTYAIVIVTVIVAAVT